MRFIALALVLCLGPLHAAELRGYAGTWILDRNASRDLPGFYDHVAQHKLVVTANGAALNVAVEIDSTAGDKQQQTLTYRIDGEKTRAQTAIRTPDGPKTAIMTSTAHANADGTLSIDSERVVPGAETPMRDREHWILAASGELHVERSFSAGGAKPFEMVFRRGAAN